MAREVDAVGLIINEAIHTAFERYEFDQVERLARLQATYYCLLIEGLHSPLLLKDYQDDL